ncbi:MAG: nucleotidyltransferase domain-containing protein [Nitrososphaeria archaeon]|nr:nucleotidyltransferase domain-containing protein [Nitrososphaeria archaeon]
MELARNWRYWTEKIAEAAKKILVSSETYVFGSIVRGQVTAASDIDILIISNHIPNTCKERGNLKAKIEEEAGLPLYHPFEIHLATEEEAKNSPVYRSIIKEAIKV